MKYVTYEEFMAQRYIQYERITGYKYRLTDDYLFFMREFRGRPMLFEFGKVYPKGLVQINKHYAWNGCNVIIDTKNNLRASLEHDFGYQLIRMAAVEFEMKDSFDLQFKKTCINDGVNRYLAETYYQALKWFGGLCCRPEPEKPKLYAPKQNLGDDK